MNYTNLSNNQKSAFAVKILTVFLTALMVIGAIFGISSGAVSAHAESETGFNSSYIKSVRYIRTGQVYSYNCISFHLELLSPFEGDFGDSQKEYIKYFDYSANKYLNGCYAGVLNTNTVYLYIDAEGEDIRPAAGDYLVLEPGFNLGRQITDDTEVIAYVSSVDDNGVNFNVFDYKLTATYAQVRELQAEKAELEAQISTLQLFVANLEAENNASSETIEQLTSQIAELTERKEALEHRLAEILTPTFEEPVSKTWYQSAFDWFKANLGYVMIWVILIVAFVWLLIVFNKPRGDYRNE